MDFLARLAALIPPPRKHLTRYHGVFAPNHAWRSRVVPRAPLEIAEPAGSTPAGADSEESTEPTTEATRESVPATVLARRLDWATLLLRVFSLDDGLTYTYCDTNGAGSNVGFDFSAAASGTWTVTP